jgi:hypothetical protein
VKWKLKTFWLLETLFVCPGVLIQGFSLTSQALYHLSHTSSSSPFCSGYFGDGVFLPIAQTSLDHDLPTLLFPL